MKSNFLDECKITRVMNAVTAGTSTQSSDRVDMTGYDSVCFVALLGDVTDTSVLELKVQQNTADHASSPTPTEITDDDVTATATATSADNKVLAMAIHNANPAAGKWLFAQILRGTANAVIDGVIAIQYNARNTPVTQAASVLASDFRFVK